LNESFTESFKENQSFGSENDSSRVITNMVAEKISNFNAQDGKQLMEEADPTIVEGGTGPPAPHTTPPDDTSPQL